MVLKGEALGRRLGYEAGALMNGISALMNETLESSTDLPVCEETVRRPQSMNQ